MSLSRVLFGSSFFLRFDGSKSPTKERTDMFFQAMCYLFSDSCGSSLFETCDYICEFLTESSIPAA